MSGGHYDFAYNNVALFIDNCRREHPRDKTIKKFLKLLEKCKEVMHDIEWADSGDSDMEDAYDLINKLPEVKK